jgi:hypothetical protein
MTPTTHTNITVVVTHLDNGTYRARNENTGAKAIYTPAEAPDHAAAAAMLMGRPMAVLQYNDRGRITFWIEE